MGPAGTKTVISASRRTDIPAFYMPWFMRQIKHGVFRQVNPYNRSASEWSATPEHVHSIVFWSKNFAPFLEAGHGETLSRMGYGLMFNFTLNSPHPLLEPRVPPLAQRLTQMTELARRFGPQAVTWRFDPICFFREGAGPQRDNLAGFAEIAQTAARVGITRCVTSFMDRYPKIDRRLFAMGGFSFIDPSLETKRAVLNQLAQEAHSHGIGLHLCCEKEILADQPAKAPFGAAACVSGERLMALYGGRVSRAADTGQRRAMGCACSRSLDVGDYRRHPCFHDCLFCYASPARDRSGTALPAAAGRRRIP